MQAALALARRGLGRVWPNPAVGCVLVQPDDRLPGGRVVGRGWTQPGGRPHAETEALRRAGADARGATAYVTLEPCAHHGQTPPCADALVAAGIARAVIAIGDPDPRVSGRGIARLKDAGIAIAMDVGAAEAQEVNAGFLMRVRAGRPLATLKLATSLDGRTATAKGESRWITGQAARQRAHLLRADHDAVMVGTRTALDDDPLLTCRLPGLQRHSPLRILLDRELRLPPTSQAFVTARDLPTWLVHAADADARRRAAIAAAGVTLLELPTAAADELPLPALLQALGGRGITRLLVEGGGRLAASLLRADLVDRVVWFRAPVMLGAEGLPAVGQLGFEVLADAKRFSRTGLATVGGDLVETYARHP